MLGERTGSATSAAGGSALVCACVVFLEGVADCEIQLKLWFLGLDKTLINKKWDVQLGGVARQSW